MSSMNEELTAPPKHRLSPFEVRNSELVSRLLAATPPYLYNMPLVPHSFFFSEMLRSLVQNKAEAAARMSNSVPHRRSRKRSWAQGRAEHYKQETASSKTSQDSQDMPPPIWTPPKIPTDRRSYNESKGILERPLELTMNKPMLNNSNSKLMNHTESSETTTSRLTNFNENPYRNLLNQPSSTITSQSEKSEMPGPSTTNQLPFVFPPLPNLTPPDTHSPSSSTSSTDLILPPPPPMWYPPLYPPPYGIDPLHFFIDLRVSGHVYDRKNQKADASNFSMPYPNPMSAASSEIMNNILDLNSAPSTNSATPSSSSSSCPSVSSPDNFVSTYNSLTKHTRHSSAFSVPTPSLNLNDPLNLTSSKYQKNPRYDNSKNERRAGKFDIKSMGFDTNPDNELSTNYILKNLNKIYRNAHESKYKHEGIDLTAPKQSEEHGKQSEVKDDSDRRDDDKENEKEKRCKDLRALIGLELVVDYVNHNVKPGKSSLSEGSSTDIDSRCSSHSAVEILTVPNI